MSDIAIVEIEKRHLDAVCGLLREGFARRSPTYWQTTMARLSNRPKVTGYPQYGLLLEVDGSPVGVILILTSVVDGHIRSNLSSWYVRQAYRKFATFLFQRSLKAKGGTYLNLSPSAVALPIATAFGFQPYSEGMILMDPRTAVCSGLGTVHPLTDATITEIFDDDPNGADIIRRHLSYGNHGLVIKDQEGCMLALYRKERVKRYVPAARFTYGDPVRLSACAGPLMRALLRRGMLLALLDRPEDVRAGFGMSVLANRNIRYAKGTPPVVGDLRDTEIALFGE